MPLLKEKRNCHSSCMISGWIYTFCGYDANGNNLKSVEKLEVFADIDEQNTTVWQQIPFARIADDFTPRYQTVVCPISDTEIVIMGGYNGRWLSDAFVLDISSDKLRKVVQEAPLSFKSYNNASVRTSAETVVALVDDDSFKPKFIEFKKEGENSFISIMNSF